MNRMGHCVGGVFARSCLLRGVCMGNRISGYGCRADKRVCFSLGSRAKALGYIVFTKREQKLTFTVGGNSGIVINKDISMCRHSNHCRVCTGRVALRNTKALCRECLTLGRRLRSVKVFTRRCGRPVPEFVEYLNIMATPANTTIRSVHGVSCQEGPCLRVVLCPTLMRKTNTTRDVMGKVRVLSGASISIVVIKENNNSVRSL